MRNPEAIYYCDVAYWKTCFYFTSFCERGDSLGLAAFTLPWPEHVGMRFIRRQPFYRARWVRSSRTFRDLCVYERGQGGGDLGFCTATRVPFLYF
jgi:hypothetical protein